MIETVKVLGTVSPFPNEGKNGPGFLIKCGKYKILLDCGPGATRLMNMEQDLENLIVIFSHLHYDHFSDFISSITYSSYVYHNLGLLENRVKVFVPKGDYYNDTENYEDGYGISDYRLVSKPIIPFQLLNNLGTESYLEVKSYNSDSVIKIDDLTITFAYNPHNITSNSIKVSDGNVSIVYSGDTGYKYNNLEKFAAGSNLLICESTFLRGQSKGEHDYHLYAYEAGKIAKIAQPGLLMLTHFWPTIPKEKYVLEAQTEFANTIAAEEGKVLQLKKLL